MKRFISLLLIAIMTVGLCNNNAFAAGIYNTDSNRQTYGSNFYGTSNIREWLNSDETNVSYTHNVPNDANVNSGQNNYENEKGFLADGNFTSAERAMIAPRSHKVLVADIDSNVKDGGTASHIYDNTPINETVSNYDVANYKMFTDRVFLLSVQELNNWVAARGWEYKAKPTAQAVANSEYTSTSLNTSSFWHYWLNTPYASSSSHVRYVHSGGNVNYNNAFANTVGVRPALNLKSEILKSSGAATINDPAALGTSGAALAVGDYVTLGKYYNQPVTWRVINKDSQGTVLFAENILSIKPYDAKGDGTYPELAKQYGEVEQLPEPDTTAPREVSNLAETHTETSTKLTWSNPVDEDFSHVIVYQNGNVVNGNVTSESIEIEGLEAATTYTFKFVTVDKTGNKSTGSTLNVTTKEIKVDEIKSVKADADFDRVDISWENPESDYFHHVNIYRKHVEEEPSFLQRLFSGTSVSAAVTEDGFTPMFQTNGTFWNDLTVSPETTYEYKLTTESTTGNESEGQIVEVTTLEEPAPEMGGEEINTDENGDYKVTWTSPTDGQVKVLVDGSEYAVVDATLGQYVIPTADMKYDLFGKPKVKLVAVSTSGKEGEPTKPPVNGDSSEIGVTMPFTVNEFLKTVLSLIGLVGPFILLALAIRFAPRIIVFLKGVIAKYREGRL